MSELARTFRGLADRRRRHAIFCLQKHHAILLADLAEFVAVREEATEVGTPSDETVRDVYFSLYHTHLPLLEDADLVRYNQEQDLVTRTNATGTLLRNAHQEVGSLLQVG